MRVALLAMTAAAILGVSGCSRASATGDEPRTPPATEPAATRVDPAEARGTATDTAAARTEREITLPAGTRLPIVLETSVGSDTSRVEQRVEARVSRAVMLHGVTVVPAGSTVSGVVTDARRSARVKGRAHVAVRFDTLVPRGSDQRYAIHTAPVGRIAQATKRKDALEILGPAAGGALIGGLVGGGKGAAIGAAAGGGGGTAVVLSTRGKEVRLPRGAALTLRLTEPVRVRAGS